MDAFVNLATCVRLRAKQSRERSVSLHRVMGAPCKHQRLRNTNQVTGDLRNEKISRIPSKGTSWMRNNAVWDNDGFSEPTGTAKQPRSPKHPWSLESDGVYSVSRAVEDNGKAPDRHAVSRQRAQKLQASEKQTRLDLDFLQAAREAIESAELLPESAGIADVTLSEDSPAFKNSQAQAPLVSDGLERLNLESPLHANKDITGDQRSNATRERTVVSTFQQSSDNVIQASKNISQSKNYNIAAVPNNSDLSNGRDSSETEQPGIRDGDQRPDYVIRPGDLVMHARFGVGRFQGLERVSSNQGPRQDFAVVEYRDRDIYISPVHLECIRPLTAREKQSIRSLDIVATLAIDSAMASGRNVRQRRAKFNARIKARAHIRQQLVNLQALYAARDMIRRESYSPYPNAEARFADLCEFELTQDQQQAVQEILSDITDKSYPMDRLLCGDVGFGKTEVALRCAFRILMSGKQVAVLAPTTILAQQHFETFRARVEAHFPEFRVVCLTRFSPKNAITESKQKITSGEAKLVIGTHMLLSKTVKFKDLGLLVVDEEHRFGVNQKEKLRCLYQNVDSLFMSATPIPRTLHLGLSGLRDISLLKTPPPGRKPVVTRVAAIGAGVIRKAIGTELERNGQVFFVCPRIEGIEDIAERIRDLFPHTKVLVAHGGHKDLESRIWAFANGRYDVLVCTTIIENGINMPRVNTLVVQDAVRFGMAQLHQLRGRVGRCSLQAYAWMLHGTVGSKTRSGYERLQAVQKFSGLGAGFAIAQRDMEMRGVGTVLGVEQHGCSSLEPDEYSKLLVEELSAMKTGKPAPVLLPKPVPHSEVCLPVASFIPPDYITSLDEKMAAYSMISSVKSAKDLSTVAVDLKRRYGPFPAPVELHFAIVRLKLYAQRLGIRRITTQRNHVVLDWSVSACALKRLVTFLEDEQARKQFESIEEEETVNIRGLGICTGNVQVAKLVKWLGAFVKISANFPDGLPGVEN